MYGTTVLVQQTTTELLCLFGRGAFHDGRADLTMSSITVILDPRDGMCLVHT